MYDNKFNHFGCFEASVFESVFETDFGRLGVENDVEVDLSYDGSLYGASEWQFRDELPSNIDFSKN
jgi:hypothetical protein